MRRLALARVLALALLACCALPGVALADDPPPACPDAPAAYSGSDDAVAMLRELRADQRASCLALVARLDRAHEDAAAMTAAAHDDANRAHTDQAATTAAVGDVEAAVQAIPAPSVSASYDGPSASAFDDAGHTLHGDLWVILGALAAAFIAVPLIRLFTPWLRGTS